MELTYTERNRFLYPEETMVETATTSLFRKSGLDENHPDHFDPDKKPSHGKMAM